MSMLDGFKDKDKIIYELWKLLDDIDTASDMAKSDNEAYRVFVEKIQNKRWKHASESYIDHLYEQFHPKEE